MTSSCSSISIILPVIKPKIFLKKLITEDCSLNSISAEISPDTTLPDIFIFSFGTFCLISLGEEVEIVNSSSS